MKLSLPMSTGLLAGDEQVGRHPAHERHDGIQQGDVDALALAGALPVEQGRHEGEGGVEAAHGVAHREPGAQGVQAFVAVDGHLPGQALDDLVVGRLQGVRAGLAEAGDGAVDQLRVQCGQDLVAQAQAVHDAGAEVLHQDVGVQDQLLEQVLAFGALGVEGDGVLVGVLGQEAGAHQRLVEFGDDAQLAGQVAVLGVLHLDDVGAQEGQVEGGEGARQDVGEVEDLDAFEHALLGHDQYPRGPARWTRPGSSRPKKAVDVLGDLDERGQVDVLAPAHPVQAVDQVLGGDVAGGHLGEGAASEAREGGLEGGDALPPWRRRRWPCPGRRCRGSGPVGFTGPRARRPRRAA